ncbi:hypothetical protein [Dendronalium sp. ChiSLP03b]|nr:hypothetical protein [Dendronalium sp. ChiSLP03b]MDZ8203499.1 hypothetical protein [Dendronalium sp. ChiSLP03b]
MAIQPQALHKLGCGQSFVGGWAIAHKNGEVILNLQSGRWRLID